MSSAFFGPFLIKIVTIPIFWILNALGYIISAVAIKKGYATELAKKQNDNFSDAYRHNNWIYYRQYSSSSKNEYTLLQGPNLNLLGIKSVNTKSKLTLDKLNKAVKKESKELDINLKTLQTHKEFQAINFLQRNRNWADGLIFIPTSWARNNYTILETILLNRD